MEISNQKFNYPDLKDIKPRLVKQPISFNLDPQNKVYLTSNGEFYYSKFRGTDKDSGEEKWSEDLKFSAPLNGMSLDGQITQLLSCHLMVMCGYPVCFTGCFNVISPWGIGQNQIELFICSVQKIPNVHPVNLRRFLIHRSYNYITVWTVIS